MAAGKNTKKHSANQPTIQNRKARHDYVISETLECGIRLLGTEVKAARAGQVSLQEGYVRATETPLEITMHGVHFAEYAPAGPQQHEPTRTRRLLVHKREIRKLASATREKGVTLVPLKMYFERGKLKVLIGLARGKRKSDKRQVLDKKQAQREIDRAMSKRM